MPRSFAAALAGLVLTALGGCSSGRCCSPCAGRAPSSVALVHGTAATNGATYESRDAGRTWTRIQEPAHVDLQLEAAKKAWSDEITDGTRSLAECLHEAEKETDPALRARKRTDCEAQFRARMQRNDETYEQMKAVIGK